MPRYFAQDAQQNGVAKDKAATPHPSPTSARLLNVLCDLSEALQGHLENLHKDMASASDPHEVERRVRLFERLLQLRRQL